MFEHLRAYKFLCACLVVINVSCGIKYDYRTDLVYQYFKKLQNNVDKQLGPTEQCKAQVDLWISILEKGRYMQNNWAWRMLDASDKIGTGILNGNTIGLGQMDECLAIDEVCDGIAIKGQYCYAGIMFPLTGADEELNFTNIEGNFEHLANMIAMERQNKGENHSIIYAMSICIPHKCNWMELTGIKDIIEFDICQTKEKQKIYDKGDWAFLIFISIIIVLVLVSTSYDWYIRSYNKNVFHPVTLAFSFYTNGEKILNISKNTEQLRSLNGIRALSMVWVVTGHRFDASTAIPITNSRHVMEWMNSTKSFYVTAASIAVDSFLFLSGVVLAYGFMKSQSKPNDRFNVILYYLHRYLRLTPAVGVIYFFYVTWFKHITSGPLWPMLQEERDDCLKNAIPYFLHIQNIINPTNQCFGHTWYLSVDMQLFIISPLILLPMVKYPKYAGFGLVTLILMSILPSTLITYYNDLFNDHKDYFTLYYFQPHTRISPWLVGLLLGFVFYQMHGREIKINRFVNVCIWSVILIGMFFILNMAPKMRATRNIVAFALYNGFHRLCWALGLMWIVFACEKGYGGLVNWFLKLAIFEVLARLSFSMYLLHVLVQTMAVLQKRTSYFFDEYGMLNEAFGDIIVVTFLAFFYCMMFEYPVVVIVKIFIGQNGYLLKLFRKNKELDAKDVKIYYFANAISENVGKSEVERL